MFTSFHFQLEVEVVLLLFTLSGTHFDFVLGDVIFCSCLLIEKNVIVASGLLLIIHVDLSDQTLTNERHSIEKNQLYSCQENVCRFWTIIAREVSLSPFCRKLSGLSFVHSKTTGHYKTFENRTETSERLITNITWKVDVFYCPLLSR